MFIDRIAGTALKSCRPFWILALVFRPRPPFTSDNETKRQSNEDPDTKRPAQRTSKNATRIQETHNTYHDCCRCYLKALETLGLRMVVAWATGTIRPPPPLISHWVNIECQFVFSQTPSSQPAETPALQLLKPVTQVIFIKLF